MKQHAVKKLIAAAASLAALVGLGAVTATSASAATAPLTINASDPAAVNGHTFTAVLLGAYDTTGITTDANGNYNGINVKTEGDLSSAIASAATSADSKLTIADASNPLESVVKDTNFLDSATSPYTGNLRNFVTTLADSSAFQTALSTAKGVAADNVPGANGTAAFSSLSPDGVYVIVDTTASLSDTDYSQSIPMLVGTKIGGKDLAGQTLGVINVKNQLPSITKELISPSPDAPYVGVGDDVHWRITGTVPNTTGYVDDQGKPAYTYTINDTLSKGLSYAGDSQVTVKVGSTTLQPSDYTITSTVNEDGSTSLSIDLSKYVTANPALVGQGITVDYHSTVNKDLPLTGGINSILNNSATLTYSNQPGENGHGKTITTPPTIKHLFSYGFKLLKQDEVTGAPLAGAQFNITAQGGSAPLKFSTVSTGYVLDPANGSATLTTGADGYITVGGLNAGTYTVAETQAPAGYQGTVLPSFTVTITGHGTADDTTLAAGAPKLTNTNDNWGLVSANNATATYTVNNVSSLTQLPLTGGAGIILFLSLAVVLGGAGFVVLRKARSASVR
ncbi:MAG: SpaH/EbpB family LPXTG-anchored major pilin [Bifidobacterium tibiigranuli]|jgi:fimbrial isopeptide formation D2 family protein|uniref:SpaH/EbpB family LPXTG-anchored major pilin n=1 Tax=Bifidobacterium tibiigranuli TaxID=2172043 RepID=UPI002356DD12|nr:SpaH/EbpB family LPXTG-anchored major pilin [Bifidobacterium tibiigranuli]MCH3975880.1 SpaH/EbpB family LPXTG-anchored major pilin [Bifidobacterium tibiigranuli]MCH4190170.1 SpaH/EbpB family LPXTG-anchored major pilin [Bifidobacterium tibiigranuli]MCH4204357.1 SpaH/EbpB family LPXTG-anchored major pilin [Bifidobacterium tibiigranuli]MCH4275122.1 SpaH/EbpB family LPXTG-anchored major pilin [Bifidobacterium tibiigranuli]